MAEGYTTTSNTLKIVAVDGLEEALVAPSKAALLAALHGKCPGEKQSSLATKAAQIWRFVRELKPSDSVLSYSPINRVYAAGKITSAATFVAQVGEETAGLGLRRSVEWQE